MYFLSILIIYLLLYVQPSWDNSTKALVLIISSTVLLYLRDTKIAAETIVEQNKQGIKK